MTDVATLTDEQPGADVVTELLESVPEEFIRNWQPHPDRVQKLERIAAGHPPEVREHLYRRTAQSDYLVLQLERAVEGHAREAMKAETLRRENERLQGENRKLRGALCELTEVLQRSETVGAILSVLTPTVQQIGDQLSRMRLAVADCGAELEQNAAGGVIEVGVEFDGLLN